MKSSELEKFRGGKVQSRESSDNGKFRARKVQGSGFLREVFKIIK